MPERTITCLPYSADATGALGSPTLFYVCHRYKQRLHIPSQAERILSHNETDMQCYAHLCGVYAIASVGPCALTFKRPVYRSFVCDDLQEGENCKHIHSSLGTGVLGEHLETSFSRRSRTDIALAV